MCDVNKIVVNNKSGMFNIYLAFSIDSVKYLIIIKVIKSFLIINLLIFIKYYNNLNLNKKIFLKNII